MQKKTLQEIADEASKSDLDATVSKPTGNLKLRIRQNTPIKTKIDVKRCYLPGIILESPCPKCAQIGVINLADEYLSYPAIGAPEPVLFVCDACATEWERSILLTLTCDLALSKDD